MAIKKKRYQSTTILRILFWLLSACGLAWQVQQIAAVYFQFQTEVDMVIEAPHNITMPALTLCIKIMYNETRLKSIYPESEQLIDWSNKVNLSFSILRYVPIKYLAQLPTVPVKFICKSPFPELNATAAQAESDLCAAKAPIRTTIQFSKPADDFYRCTTYFHCRSLPSPYQVIRVNDKDFYKVNIYTGHTTELYDSLDSDPNRTAVLAFVHNPREILHVAEADSFQFYTEQTEYMVLASWKSKTILLPAPFRTNCFNYSNMEHGRTGCIYNCRKESVHSSCPEIWPWNVPAPIDSVKPFDIRDRTCFVQVKSKCNDDCQAECLNYWYTTTLVSIIEKRTRSNLTNFSVRRPFGVEIQYIYSPRVDDVEFMCYIASICGIWLGISFLDLAHLLTDSVNNWLTRRGETKIFLISRQVSRYRGYGRFLRHLSQPTITVKH